MATWSARITASGNDGLWWVVDSVGFSGTSTNILFGYHDSVGPINTFLRYPSLAIPKGATINSAVVTFRAAGTNGGFTVNVRIRAIASDNAAAPTTSSGADSATRTTTLVDWSSVPSWTNGVDYDSPNIATVVQEIVNRSGWASGNAMVLYIEDNGSQRVNTNYRWSHSYDSNPTISPLLTINYTEPGSGAPLLLAMQQYAFTGGCL